MQNKVSEKDSRIASRRRQENDLRISSTKLLVYMARDQQGIVHAKGRWTYTATLTCSAVDCAKTESEISSVQISSGLLRYFLYDGIPDYC